MTVRNVVPLRQQNQLDAEPPPHNMEVEQALLGALMQRNAGMAEIAATLETGHFFGADHQQIFATIARLIAQGVDASPITVKGYLSLADIGGLPTMQYLAQIYNAVSTTQAAGYARIVRDFAMRRRLLIIAEDMAERARHDPLESSGSTLIHDVEGELILARAEMPHDHHHSRTAGEGASWMLDRVRGLKSGEIKSSAVPSGIADFDRVTHGGWQRGQLSILAARPGVGKTVAMTSMSRYAARDHGVLVFQFEVTEDQQWARYYADLSYVHNRPLTFGQIMAGQVDDEGLWRLEDARKRLGKLHLTVDCRPGISVAQIAFAIKAEKKRLAAKGISLGLVFIDYLKFIRVADRYKGQRNNEIGEISGALKMLAKAEDIGIVLLTQLNRQTDQQGREDRRPVLSDLRDSGELEQDADNVLFLYRDAYYLERKVKAAGNGPDAAELITRLVDCQHSLELILGKNRAGPCTTLNLWCDVAASSIAQTARGPV